MTAVAIPGFVDAQLIGVGGFSSVYRARQEGFDRHVAVKVLDVDPLDPRSQRRFERECRATGRVSSHPNIVTILDSGFTPDGHPYLVTEYCANGSLATLLDREGALGVPRTLAAGVALAGALQSAHDAGILHRDIKPQNILLSEFGEPLLADFGIALDSSANSLTTTSTTALTALHAAPEIIDGQPATPASDIYSLGSTLYTLLAGRPPFVPHDNEALVRFLLRVQAEEPPPLGSPDVAPWLSEMFLTAMAKDPARRWASAVDFGRALQSAQEAYGLPPTPIRVNARTRPTEPVPPRPDEAPAADAPVPPAAAVDDATRVATQDSGPALIEVPDVDHFEAARAQAAFIAVPAATSAQPPTSPSSEPPTFIEVPIASSAVAAPAWDDNAAPVGDDADETVARSVHVVDAPASAPGAPDMAVSDDDTARRRALLLALAIFLALAVAAAAVLVFVGRRGGEVSPGAPGTTTGSTPTTTAPGTTTSGPAEPTGPTTTCPPGATPAAWGSRGRAGLGPAQHGVFLGPPVSTTPTTTWATTTTAPPTTIPTTYAPTTAPPGPLPTPAPAPAPNASVTTRVPTTTRGPAPTAETGNPTSTAPQTPPC